MDWVQNHLNNHKKALEQITSTDVMELVTVCTEALKRGSRIFVIGNGGSAANASHFAEDLGKGANDVVHKNPVSISAREFGLSPGYFKIISLTDSVPYITAIGNDYSFDDIFLRQLQPLAAEKNDVLIGISVSGTSPNLRKAFSWASGNGLYCVALTGLRGRVRFSSIQAHANLSITIQSEHYAIVEDCSMSILHMVVYYIMEKLQ